MRTTIDAAGRVVIPKSLRERLGLTGGQQVEIRDRGGYLEIEPAAVAMALQDGPGGVVAVPAAELPPLTDDLVRATLERVRR
jgi:AbrB family looped-hinge helix DNA binding protein